MGDAFSTPFKITLPSGTKLFAITRTAYKKDGNVVKPANSIGTGDKDGSVLTLFTEVTRDKWDELSGGIRYAAPGTGAPKYYNSQGLYNQAGNRTWDPVLAGAELQQEMAKFNAGKPSVLKTAIQSGVGAVALATGTSSAGLTQKLFNPTAPPPAPPGGSPPDQPIPTGKTEAVPSGEEGKLNMQLKKIADPDLRYPLDIGKNKQDYIKFQALKIKPRTGGSSASNTINLQFSFGSRGYEDVDGPVFLPIQAGISDQNSVDWGPDNVNAIDAALYNASISLMQPGSAEDLGNKVGDLAGKVSKELRAQGGRFGRYLAGQAAGINNVLSRTDNVVLNPNLELLFSGPQLRPFSFQFKMSARSEKEAIQIKKIIKYFKYHMAVRQEVNKLFLRAPNIFKIEYTQLSRTTGLNLIKECALTNCSVDYTPLGSYMTYEDGSMVAYTLSLQFQELEPIYDINYTEDQKIGY